MADENLEVRLSDTGKLLSTKGGGAILYNSDSSIRWIGDKKVEYNYDGSVRWIGDCRVRYTGSKPNDRIRVVEKNGNSLGVTIEISPK